jgi:hypothetical protein
MLLTGKALRDFYKFIFEKYNLQPYNVSNEIFENALIIEWLDSVKLTITVQYCIDTTFDSFLDIQNKEEIECCQFSETRPEATQKAIEKANEIYNNLNTKQDEK